MYPDNSNSPLTRTVFRFHSQFDRVTGVLLYSHITDPTSETPLYVLDHFSICTCFLVWYLEKKRRCKTKGNSRKLNSTNPGASNDHAWIANNCNFETLKELSDDLWNKKTNILTYVIPRWAITVVYRSKTFKLSQSYRSRTSSNKTTSSRHFSFTSEESWEPPA